MNVYKTLLQLIGQEFEYGDNTVANLDGDVISNVVHYITCHVDSRELIAGLNKMTYDEAYQAHKNNVWRWNDHDMAYTFLNGKLLREVGYELINKNGRFVVRLKKYLRKDCGIKSLLDNDYCKIATEVGNWLERQKMTYEFVDKLNWNAGDFGDSGSCYWGSNAAARDTLEENGCLAIRFYKGDSGCGRAWVVPLPSHVEEDGAVCVFNRYGTPRDMESVVNAVLKVSKEPWFSKRVELYNDTQRGGIIYTNGDAYLITSIPRESVKRVDLHMNIVEGKYFDSCCGRECGNCGDNMDEDDTYYDPNGNYLCETCFLDMCCMCRYCGETKWKNDSYPLDQDESEYICDRCFNKKGYSKCDNCSCAVENTSETTSGTYLCEYCADDLPICAQCGLLISGTEYSVPQEDTNEDEVILCHVCYKTCTYTCSVCNLVIYNPDEHDNICDKCKEEESNEKDET